MFKRRLISTAVCAAALITASQASAQKLLEEVIVTAQKREQSLQDVPVAVTAFTGERLVESGIRDFYEVSNIDPALIVGKSQTSTTASFSIRGVFTSSQNFGLESSVGLYVDGVYRARQSAMINNLVDINSIEVLRGPQ
ncbi:MAG: TonB-dependent receptor plug domain-containing protein, partial [Halieaceae bacterium]|nr:TonB-dependent receptor plug domain-containing protein [Halieaceae bacterium]